MKKCVVIGGGFAGLTASAYLVKSGYHVELIEASPKLGGRAYSFFHKETSTIVDNGQHIMMGCYEHTLDFLSLIGSLDKVQVQEKMNVNLLKPGFNPHELKASSLPYPLNFFSAILNFSAVTFRERLSVLRVFLKLPFLAKRDLEKLSVDEFLFKEQQNENVKKALWEILCVGALNTNIKNVSAKVFVDVLKEIFLKGSKGAKIILPKVGLSEMFCEPVKQFIEKKGGKIFLSERVEGINVDMNRAVEVRTNQRNITDFDFVVCAVPFFALERVKGLFSNNEHHSTIQSFPPEAGRQLRYSSILTAHVWLKENRLGKNFYALVSSKLHWVFNHQSHLTCVISDADYLMNLSDEEIMDMIYSELDKYLNIPKQSVTDYLIIKEKRATFIPSNEILNNRPNTKTDIKNFFLAGDWVNTGLPSTIESAVKSGRMAADKVIDSLRFEKL
jgi:squalene-associated FAD-dependent desaturase